MASVSGDEFMPKAMKLFSMRQTNDIFSPVAGQFSIEGIFSVSLFLSRYKFLIMTYFRVSIRLNCTLRIACTAEKLSQWCEQCEIVVLRSCGAFYCFRCISGIFLNTLFCCCACGHSESHVQRCVLWRFVIIRSRTIFSLWLKMMPRFKPDKLSPKHFPLIENRKNTEEKSKSQKWKSIAAENLM